MDLDHRARLAAGIAAVAVAVAVPGALQLRGGPAAPEAAEAGPPAQAAVRVDAKGDVVLDHPELVSRDLTFGLPRNCEQVKVAMGLRVTTYGTSDQAPPAEQGHMILFGFLGEQLCPYRDYATFRARFLKAWAPEYELEVAPPLPGPPGAFRD